MIETFPEPLAKAVKATLEDWKANNKVQRLWAHDASLWTNADEGKWLGWLGIVEEQLAKRKSFQQIAEEIRAAGFTHAVLLGMGGSSLCVEVLELTFGKVPGYPKISTLDSTDPAQIKARRIEARSREIGIHRVEQIRQHARAEYFQAIFL